MKWALLHSLHFSEVHASGSIHKHHTDRPVCLLLKVHLFKMVVVLQPLTNTTMMTVLVAVVMAMMVVIDIIIITTITVTITIMRLVMMTIIIIIMSLPLMNPMVMDTTTGSVHVINTRTIKAS